MRGVTSRLWDHSQLVAQTAKGNVDFYEIAHVGSHGSTGDLCLKDTGEEASAGMPRGPI